MTETTPIQVAILAPNLAMRVGLRTLISTSESIQVVAEAAEIAELDARRAEIDVILLQGQAYLEGLATLIKGEARLALLWVNDDPQAAYELRGLPLRAWGLLSSEAAAQELSAAIMAVNQGLVVAPQAMLDSLLDSLWVENPQNSAEDLIDQLTPREAEILQLLAQGLANKQIALELEISEHTVKFHISSIYTKLGATNRMEAVRLGLQMGLITL